MDDVNIFNYVLEKSGWKHDVARQIIAGECANVMSAGALNTAQFLLIYEEACKFPPATEKLSVRLRQCCPDFMEPTHWSSIIRKAKTRLSNRKQLEQPIFQSFNTCNSAPDIGPFCSKLNISILDVSSHTSSILTGHPLNIGAFHEIVKAKNKLKKTWLELADFINRIKPVSSLTFSQQKVQYFANKISTEVSVLSKNKKTQHLEQFKETDFFSFTSIHVHGHPSSLKPKCSCPLKELKQMNLKLVQLSEDLTNDKESYEYENKVLLETLKEQKKELNKKQSQLEKLEDMQIKVRKLRTKNSILNQRLLYKQKEITSLKKENYVKRLKRQHKKMKSLSEARKKQVEKIKTKFRTVKKIKKNYKVLLTLAKSNIENIKMENKKVMNRFYSKVNYWKQEALRKKQSLNQLESEKEDLKQVLIARQKEEIEIQENNNEFRTKENNRYTDDMRMCVMDLQSLDISNNKIGDVIKSVGTNIFKQQLEIPSKTTIQNIADEALVLSKYHVAERLKESDNFGLFSDGTSREGRKIMDIGVHLEDATMSLGYKVIATEDAKTVSELLKSSIQEFGEITEGEDLHNDLNFNTNGLLKKLTTVMSDRCSVMKSSNKILNEWRKNELMCDDNQNAVDDIEFLYCSAHVLLGFYTKIEKKMRSRHDVLGRDKLPQFSRFKSTEPPALRLIRMASECLGPRGDEKNGARQQWLSYMDAKKRKSQIIGYRSNRFNNLFQGALSLVEHRNDIIDFLSTYFENPNSKLQSVLEDAKCDVIFSQVLALAVVYNRVTLPYWNLINSSEHYLDLHQFIKPLHEKLKVWEVDSTKLLQNDMSPLFEKFPHINNGLLLQEINKHLAPVLNETSFICECLKEVVEKQLNDFILDGKYSNEPSCEAKQKTIHCKLTNISAENLFGDLDFSMKRKPTATLRHHSAIIMLKRNQPLKWINKKSKEAKKHIFSMARKNATKIKQNEKLYENRVRKERWAKINSVKLKKKEKEKKQQNEMKRIENSVRKMGGIIKTSKDLESLLEKTKTMRDKKGKIRDQLLFLKHFLGKNVENKKLRISQTLKQLKQNLYDILDLNHVPDFCCGMFVAVAYEDTWYPGEILNITDSKISVKFLHPKRKGGLSFVWPNKDDVKDVHRNFVILRNLTVEPTPGLRFWIIHEYDDIEDLYEKYREEYF